VEVTGLPSHDDFAAINSDFAARMLESLPPTQSPRLQDIFPHACDEALDLLRQCLQFNPFKRITTKQALNHPYVAAFHNEDEEIICDHVIKISVDDDKSCSQPGVKSLLNEAIRCLLLEVESSSNKSTAVPTQPELDSAHQTKEECSNFNLVPKQSHTGLIPPGHSETHSHKHSSHSHHRHKSKHHTKSNRKESPPREVSSNITTQILRNTSLDPFPIQSNVSGLASERGRGVITADVDQILRGAATRVMLTGVRADESRIIGEGSFGWVFKGSYCGREMAIKRLKLVNAEVVADLIREASLMSEIRHPNVVMFYGLWRDNSNRLHLVTEWMDHGSLLGLLEKEYDRLANGEPSQVTIRDLIDICLDVARAMQRLAELNIYHCDLAARNVLLTKSGSRWIAKVADFGLTQVGQNNHSYVYDDQAKIPVYWSAPEVLTRRKFSTYSDVWSFGVLCWEVFSYGMIPYHGVFPSNAALKSAIVKGTYVLEQPDCCPFEVYQLMLQCFKLEPRSRITFPELVDAFEKIAVYEN
jgi:serine/threonine protein kinase